MPRTVVNAIRDPKLAGIRIPCRIPQLGSENGGRPQVWSGREVIISSN